MEWFRRPIRLDFFDLFISRPYFADLDMSYMLNWFLLCGPIAKRSTSCCIPDFLLVEKTSCILHLLFFVGKKKGKRGPSTCAKVKHLSGCNVCYSILHCCLCTPIHREMIQTALSAIQVFVRTSINSHVVPLFAGVCQICLAWRSDRYPRRMSYLCHTAPVFFLMLESSKIRSHSRQAIWWHLEFIPKI
jgi:hypothetical protein